MALFERAHAAAWVIWLRDVTFLLSGARNGQKIAMISQFCDIIFPPDDVSSHGALVAPASDWVTYFFANHVTLVGVGVFHGRVQPHSQC